MTYCRSNLSNSLTTDMERVYAWEIPATLEIESDKATFLFLKFYMSFGVIIIINFCLLFCNYDPTTYSVLGQQTSTKFKVTLTPWIIAWQLDVMGSNLESAFGPSQMEFWSFCWHIHVWILVMRPLLRRRENVGRSINSKTHRHKQPVYKQSFRFSDVWSTFLKQKAVNAFGTLSRNVPVKVEQTLGGGD